MSEAGNETLGLFYVFVPSPYVPGVEELALVLLTGEEVLPSKLNLVLFKTADILACFLGFSGMFFCTMSGACVHLLQAHVTQCVSVNVGDTEHEECVFVQLWSSLAIESRVAMTQEQKSFTT
ncbi:hypothetical protein AMECASPLE_038061 [Ameca splendens]|uniref:Uncharacterized protein n=1 Tax=Ameca splendens TaxID=208324 RepID=A0ABV0Z7P8_9TELE